MIFPSALEQLLPELQQRILLQLESFDSLYALILASPRIYQVFRLNRKTVLSKLAYQHFDSAAVQAALAIENLCRIESPPFSRETVLEFFNPAVDDPGEYHSLIIPLPVSTRLGKLDGTIKFFINDYTQNTVPILTQLSNSEPPTIRTKYTRDYDAPKMTISRSESDRLRRAFCRFENYRQLFSRCSTNLDHNLRRCSYEPSLTIYEQADFFFQNMPAYQAAEIACVRDYLYRRLRGVIDLVEDEIVQKLQAGCPKPQDKNQALEWDSWANEGRYQYLYWDEHYFGYSGKDFQENHIEYLLSLGLPYVRRLLESAGDEREDLLLRSGANCYSQDDTHFITAALGLELFTHNEDAYGRYDRSRDSCLDEESKSDLPPGWLWAHADGYYMGLVDLHFKGLRDWGYVFWDLERLQKAGILDLDPNQVNRTKFSDYRANERPSVQERWFGPRLPLSEDEDEDEEEEKGEEKDDEDEDKVEDEDEDEKNGTFQSEVGEQVQKDTEDKYASHELSTALLQICQWLWESWQDWWRLCDAKRTAASI